MESYLPNWLIDIASISSITGLFVTIFLLYEAREIRKSFLRRARLPEIKKELDKYSKKLSGSLKNWGDEKKLCNEYFAIIRGLLENISPKLPNEEKKQVIDFIKSLKKRKWLIVQSILKIETEDQGWDLFAELSHIITRLDQLHKDYKWG